MSISTVPKLPAGHIHFASTRIILNDEDDGTQEIYWIHSFANLMTGQTRRVYPAEVAVYAMDLEVRGELPVFGGRS